MVNSRTRSSRLSLVDRVYERLRTDILTRHFEPGAMLDEQRLAEQYAVSRTPVREALRRLGQDGLVLTIQRRGSFVRRPTLQDITEIDQIRSLLEPAAALMAAGHINADKLAEIDEEFKSMQASNSRDVKAFLRLDASLHELILKSSGNTLLCEVVTMLHDRTRAERPLSTAGRVPAAIIEVRHIIHALQRNDGAAARDAMRAHLKASMDNRLQSGFAPSATAEFEGDA